jgi:Uma2 family endonuclease
MIINVRGGLQYTSVDDFCRKLAEKRGEVYKPILSNSDRHDACVKRLVGLFAEKVGGQLLVACQQTVKLSERYQAHPDLTFLIPRAEFVTAGELNPQGILLVVEVADTTVEAERYTKIPLYGTIGIPEVWLVNMKNKCVEVYWHPSEKRGYRKGRRYVPSERIYLGAYPDLNIRVDEALG